MVWPLILKSGALILAGIFNSQLNSYTKARIDSGLFFYMKIFTKRFHKTLSKLQDSFLTENRENKKMLDTYIKFAEGSVSEEELENANSQLQQILKNLGLGILIVLPFSPITLPYIFTKAKELNIDLIPNWYKSLSNEDDRLE